jgi:hypothetical protein
MADFATYKLLHWDSPKFKEKKTYPQLNKPDRKDMDGCRDYEIGQSASVPSFSNPSIDNDWV